jgi:hypothetical protein
MSDSIYDDEDLAKIHATRLNLEMILESPSKDDDQHLKTAINTLLEVLSGYSLEEIEDKNYQAGADGLPQPDLTRL